MKGNLRLAMGQQEELEHSRDPCPGPKKPRRQQGPCPQASAVIPVSQLFSEPVIVSPPLTNQLNSSVSQTLVLGTLKRHEIKQNS